MKQAAPKDTDPTIIFQCNACLVGVRSFDKDKFILPHFVEDALVSAQDEFSI